MAIDLSAIYSNPLLEPDHYFAQIERVEVEDVGASKPRLRIDLRLDRNDKQDIDSTKLSAILHPSEKSAKHYEAFESAFGITNGQYKDAEGKWGMVYARENLYKGTAHSIVKFHKLTKAVKKKVTAIEQEAAQAEPADDFGG